MIPTSLRSVRFPSSRGLVGGTLLLSSGQFVARAVGFGSSLVAAAVLSPNELGAFGFLSSTAAVLAGVGVLGLSPLMTQAVAERGNPAEARGVASVAVQGSAAFLVILGAGYIAAAVVGVNPSGSALSVSGVAPVTIGAWALTMGLNPLLMAVFVGFKRFPEVNALIILRALLVGGGLITGGVSSRAASGAVNGAVLGEAVTTIVVVTLLFRFKLLGAPRRADWASGRRLLVKGAVGSGLASFLIQAAVWGSQLLLTHSKFGYAANGGFLIANRLTLLVTFIPSAIATSSIPFLAGAPFRDARRRRRRILIVTCVVSIIAALVCVVGSYILVGRIIPRYLEYRDTISIMAGAGILIALNNVIGSMAVAARQIGRWVWSDVVLAAAIILLAGVAVPKAGANGIAFAMAVAYGLSILVLLPILRPPRKRAELGG